MWNPSASQVFGGNLPSVHPPRARACCVVCSLRLLLWSWCRPSCTNAKQLQYIMVEWGHKILISQIQQHGNNIIFHNRYYVQFWAQITDDAKVLRTSQKENYRMYKNLFRSCNKQVNRNHRCAENLWSDRGCCSFAEWWAVAPVVELLAWRNRTDRTTTTSHTVLQRREPR